MSLLLLLFYICSILSDVWVKAVTRWRTCAANARESSVKMALLTLHVLRWPCRHVGAVRLLGHVSVFLSQCATCWSLVRIAIFKKSTFFLFIYFGNDTHSVRSLIYFIYITSRKLCHRSALQVLHKACEVSRRFNYFPGGIALTWISFYESCITSEQSFINEWNTMTDLETTRPDSPTMFVDR